jgi:hypothetical protein
LVAALGGNSLAAAALTAAPAGPLSALGAPGLGHVTCLVQGADRRAHYQNADKSYQQRTQYDFLHFPFLS